MEQPLQAFRAAYDSPYDAARAYRAKGGKVVGYLLNAVPEELIVAANCFPVRLRGEPQRSAIADRYMEPYMDGEVRSIFGALLEGRFDFIDLLVIPRSSEMHLQLYYFLLEIQKWEPAARLPPLYMFDLLQTPSSTTLKYVVGRLRDLAERLATLGGGNIDAQALSTAITAVNAKRKLLQQASVLWQSATPSLTGVDALTVISCGSFMTQQDYLARLDALLASPPPSFATGPRILIKGSSQSDLRFTTLVEGLGGSVVAHDHLWGDRTYATAVEERTEPWGALARHYCLDIPSPREYPQAKADARFLDLVQRARVTGVIFYHDEWDDTLGWEYPDQKQLLDRHGVPSLFLKRQPYFEPPELQQAEAVRAFLDTLRRTP